MYKSLNIINNKLKKEKHNKIKLLIFNVHLNLKLIHLKNIINHQDL